MEKRLDHSREDFVDNKPNLELVLSYDKYRKLMDRFSGIMRIGVYEEETYKQVIVSASTCFAHIDGSWLPIAASNADLHEYNKESMEDDVLMSIVSEDLLEGCDSVLDIEPGKLVIPQQRNLNDLTVAKILSKPRAVSDQELTQEISEDGRINLYSGTGLPEFVVLSAYDASMCADLKKTPPQETEMVGDNIFTTSPEFIMDRLPELIKLHQDIFNEQAPASGYYAGINEEDIQSAIASGEFIPIAVFERDASEEKGTGRALCFALFSPNFTDYDSIKWLNPSHIHKTIEEQAGGASYVVSVPYVITSKGLNLFPKITDIAARETIYRTKADTFFVLNESSNVSIHGTPAILNRKIEQLGLECKKTIIEATYLTVA